MKFITFGFSGFLYRSNKLMYDRHTDTLWHQLWGTPAFGPLVGSGIQLERLPVLLTTCGKKFSPRRSAFG